MTNEEIRSRIAMALVQYIEPLFKGDVQITLIARVPGDNDADVFVSADEGGIDAVVALLERSRTRSPIGN